MRLHHPKPSALVRQCVLGDGCLFLAWTSDLPEHLSRAPRGLTVKAEQSVGTDLSWVVDRFTHSQTTQQQAGEKLNVSIDVEPFVIYPVPLSPLTP